MPAYRPPQTFISLRVRLMILGLVVILISFPILQTYADSAGYALQFDGANDFVELTYTAHIMGTGWETLKTVSVWVKPLGSAVVCEFNAVGFCDNVFGDRSRWWGITRGVLNGQDRLWIWNYDNSPGSPADLIGIEYVAGEWVHVSLVHGGGILRAYKNGVQVGSVASGATIQPNGGALPKLQLGGIINNTSRVWTFEGILDEVSLWNVARTEAEVQGDLYQSLAGNEPGLRAYYSMSDGTGITLTDDSVNNWNGTLFDGGVGVPPNGSPPVWITSDVFGDGTPMPTPTDTPFATTTATPPPTSTSVPTATNTGEPSTATATPPSMTATPTSTATPTTNPDPGAFPSTGVLDTFNRVAGPIGSNWSGNTGSYAIANNQLDVNGNGSVFWNAPAFGADQEAYVTLTTIDPTGSLSLILKSQSSTTASNGVIRVQYTPTNQVVQIWTYSSAQNWVQRGTNLSVTFVTGDQFGAKAKADGTVEVYKNGVFVGSRSVTGWPFYASGGYVGLWMATAPNTLLDNFGGGTILLGPISTPTDTPLATSTATATPPPTNTSVPTVTNTGAPSTATATPPPMTATPTTMPTVSPTPSGGFPATGVLDDFNRPNGALGTQWSGNTTSYAIAANLLDVVGNGNVLWNAASFGANQEAFVTLTTLGLNSSSLSLLLKAQSSPLGNNGVIQVTYIPSSQVVQVRTYAPSQGWVQQGTSLAVALVDGDQWGAKTTTSGVVEIYKNGVLVGSRNVSSWPYVTNGGYIGLWLASASNALLDNFGGGTIGGN